MPQTAATSLRLGATILGAFATIMTWNTNSRACVPDHEPTIITRPAFRNPGDLVVDQEVLLLHCGGGPTGAHCEWEARYRLIGKGDSPRRVRGLLGFHRGEDPRISVGGFDVRKPLAAEEEAYVAAVHKGVRAVAFEFELKPNQAMDVVMSTRFDAPMETDSCFPSAVQVRHPVLGSDPREQRLRFRTIMLGPQGEWFTPTPNSTDVRVRRPQGWVLRVASLKGAGSQNVQDMKWTEAPTAPLEGVEVVDVVMTAPGKTVSNGGVTLSAGWTFGDFSGMRFKTSYELSGPVWMVHSVGLESDLRKQVIVVPSTEVADSSWLGIAPSLSLGAGIPLQLKPGFRVGGSLHVGANIKYLGLTTHVTYFPAKGDDSALKQVTIMARASF